MLHIPVLILAAGSSSRMGKIKQLLPWKETTLLGNAIAAAIAANAGEVIVVLGSNATQIKKRIPENNITILENEAWNEGMGSSIRCGMDYILSKAPQLDGVLIMLGDQPFLGTDHLNRLITIFEHSKHRIAGTNYGKRVGVPAIFGENYFPELQELSADYGARKILLKYSSDCVTVDAGEKTMDIDSIEDYNALLRHSD